MRFFLIKGRHFLILIAAFTALLAQASYAMLDLELTQGVAASIPIAILPWSGESPRVAGGQSFAQVIQHDLENSGEFRVVSQGADYLLTGSAIQNGKGQYTIRAQLRSAFDTQTTTPPLLEATFNSSDAALRAVAHRMSDDIYAKLTGHRGIFSTRIAYVVVSHRDGSPRTTYQLEVADADGFNPRVLLTSAEPIMSPAWSPDGKKLVYVSFEGHRASVYVQTLATGERQVLSGLPGINSAPAFSPNGQQLALVLSKTGNPNIYLMDLNTRQLRALTSTWAIDTEPAFSPDGRFLVFTSSRDGSPQLYQYTMATGAISRLTFDGNYNARASYTADGRWIVMMHRDHHGFGVACLDRVDLQTQVLVQSGTDESPSVAPNGKMIIYATQYEGRGVLAQVSIDGRIRLRLPAREGSVQEPAWSPFLTH